ncbi:hypothetical protein [Sphingomonas sp.]|uniref:hypothetical protein n=1 Tax=Sphingomonas sp. TaxID=28214 RepID=UPI0035A8E001
MKDQLDTQAITAWNTRDNLPAIREQAERLAVLEGVASDVITDAEEYGILDDPLGETLAMRKAPLVRLRAALTTTKGPSHEA